MNAEETLINLLVAAWKEIDIILVMKLLAMILALPMAALAVTVEPLPPSEYADTDDQPERARCPFHKGEDVWNGHLARSAVQSEFDLSSPLTFTSAPPMVTPEDIARGWQLVEERTNCNVSYTMPESATLATNWWVRGAYEDVKPFDFGSWRFPFGTNEYDSAWAFTWGKIRFTLADTNDAHLRCARRRDGRHCDVFH